MIRRRELFIAGMATSLVAISGTADACSIFGRPRVEPIDERECRAELQRLVDFLNQAHDLPVGEVEEWLEESGVSIRDYLRMSSDYPNEQEVAQWAKTYRVSDGTVDPKPVELFETNLIRNVDHNTAMQFTLRSYRFNAADPEGCNGLLTHDAYFGYEQDAYIGTFYNNRLRYVRRFDEWFAPRSELVDLPPYFGREDPVHTDGREL